LDVRVVLAQDCPNQRGDFATLARVVAGPDADPLASYVSFEPDSLPWRALGEVDRYEQVFGTRSDFFTACSFDAVTIPAHAINMAGSAEPGAVRDVILAIRGHGSARLPWPYGAFAGSG